MRRIVSLADHSVEPSTQPNQHESLTRSGGADVACSVGGADDACSVGGTDVAYWVGVAVGRP